MPYMVSKTGLTIGVQGTQGITVAGPATSSTSLSLLLAPFAKAAASVAVHCAQGTYLRYLRRIGIGQFLATVLKDFFSDSFTALY